MKLFERQNQVPGRAGEAVEACHEDDIKQAARFSVPHGEVPPVLEQWFNPFVVLLDRERAQARCRLKLVKRDAWYTYVTITPRGGRMPASFADARATTCMTVMDVSQ